MEVKLCVVKLCRFELASSPTHPRSGIVYGSKVYETDGTNPVGVHDWSEVRLLSPVGSPPSIRLFSPPPVDATWELAEDFSLPEFQYLNPAALAGPGLPIQLPQMARSLGADPCLAIIIAGSGKNVSVSDSDGLVLGLCLACSFYVSGTAGARSRDAGISIGPAITTPDELDDAVTEDERGRRYRFAISYKVNSEEVGKFDLTSLPFTVAELLSFASETCVLQQGDVIAIQLGRNSRTVERGDQVQTASDKLGLLTSRVA